MPQTRSFLLCSAKYKGVLSRTMASIQVLQTITFISFQIFLKFRLAELLVMGFIQPHTEFQDWNPFVYSMSDLHFDDSDWLNIIFDNPDYSHHSTFLSLCWSVQRFDEGTLFDRYNRNKTINISSTGKEKCGKW